MTCLDKQPVSLREGNTANAGTADKGDASCESSTLHVSSADSGTVQPKVKPAVSFKLLMSRMNS